MKARCLLVVLLGLVVVFCTAWFLLRPAPCEVADDPPVASPDERWSAASRMEACPVGLLLVTSCSIAVTLKTNASKTPTVIFASADAAETPSLTWLDQRHLLLTLHDQGVVATSLHQVKDVTITYVLPRSIWNSLNAIDADRLRAESETKKLREAGKLSQADSQASNSIDEAVAKERNDFRNWVIANATVEAPAP